MDTEDEEKTEEQRAIERMAETLEMAPISINQLAEAHGADPGSKTFRRAHWQARERFRELTGIHIVEREGMLVPVTGEEQLTEAEKRFRTAQARTRRGVEMVSHAIRRDPATQSKAERTLARAASRAAAEDGGVLRELEGARRKRLLGQ